MVCLRYFLIRYKVKKKETKEKIFEFLLEIKVIFLHNKCSSKFSVMTNRFGTFFAIYLR